MTKSIRSSFNTATENGDADGVEFYDHLMSYLALGSKAVNCVLSETESITEAIELFESLKDEEAVEKKKSNPNLDILKSISNDIEAIISDCKAALPMS